MPPPDSPTLFDVFTLNVFCATCGCSDDDHRLGRFGRECVCGCAGWVRKKRSFAFQFPAEPAPTPIKGGRASRTSPDEPNLVDVFTLNTRCANCGCDFLRHNLGIAHACWCMRCSRWAKKVRG